MYIPKHYLHKDQEEILAFIQGNNFGSLISSVSNRPWATHIPFMVRKENESLYLAAHFSKANEQWKSIEGQEIMAIFQGPHAYISSSWYDHENVPTWNYTAVHVYGNAKILNEEERYLAVKELVDHHEHGRENRVSMEAMSEDTLRQLEGIVAIEIKVTEIQAKRKLSQNRDEKNFNAVVDKLEESGEYQAKKVAEKMKEMKGN